MPILKQKKNDSTRATDQYLEREKEGSDLPRVLYEWGQHCRPETAQAEFRALREEHGRQGETRRVPAKYVEPEDPADATHIKVGKNWRAARGDEVATHQRIEPQVPVERRPEVYHDIISFGLDEVDRDDPQQCRKAFEFVVAYYEKHHPGEQIKLVAHGDAEGSKVAQERGEAGKFHVHAMRNAIIHTEMESQGRYFEPGMRVAGPLTHVDTRRDLHDAFLAERGREFGLGPQKLPPSRSKEARAVRATDQDFFERERGIADGSGRISHHDRARRGMEAAFEALSKDPDGLAGLSQGDRMRRLAEEVRATGDGELKLRELKSGEVRIRSFEVPGRKQAIGSTKLGDRYANDGVAEQLDLIAQGQWTPHERPQAGPAKEVPELLDMDVRKLQRQADALALEEQREVELDAWLAEWAAEEGTTVDRLWTGRDMTGTPAERETAHGWKDTWEKEKAAKAIAEAERRSSLEPYRDEYGEELAALSDLYARDYLARNPGAAQETAELMATGKLKARAHAGELQSDLEAVRSEVAAVRQQVQPGAEPAPEQPKTAAPETTPDAPTGPPTAKAPDPKPARKRQERQVGILSGDRRKDVELVAVVHGEHHNGGAYVDFQVAADAPAAQGQQGLHLVARTQERADGRTTTKTWTQLGRRHYEQLKEAAGDTRTTVDGKEVLALRGDIAPAGTGKGYTIDARSMRPSQRESIDADVLEAQRRAEDSARTSEKDRAPFDGTPTRPQAKTASDEFSDAVKAAESSRERGGMGR